MKTEILKLLRETDGYVSGQQISERFGVSRTAVWKVIHQLQKDGYWVEAVRNKGYHIVDSPDVMTKEELSSLINTRWAGRNILYYDVTDSTNLRIKQVGDEGAPHGTLAVADRQTAGRGRRGRTWESPAGSSIYMSILLRPEIAPNKASMLTLVMALSVAEGIRQCMSQAECPALQIKWPNDYQREKAGWYPDRDEQPDRLYQSCDHRRWYQCEYNRISGRNRADGDLPKDRVRSYSETCASDRGSYGAA